MMTSMTAWVAAAVLVSAACTKAEPKPEPAPTVTVSGSAGASAGSASAGSAGGSGIDVQIVCEAGCRNYFSLAFWNAWDPEINAAPEAEQAALRKEKAIELERKLQQGLGMCVVQCLAAENVDQVECMAKATTFAEVNACAPTEAEAASGNPGQRAPTPAPTDER